MTPQKQDFFIQTGNSYNFNFTFTTGSVSGSVPVNISGSTIYFTAKHSLQDSDADAIISADITTFPNAASGSAVYTLTPSDTALLVDSQYFYDFKWSPNSGSMTTILYGKLNSSISVTQRHD